jgi:hypothetical protein
MNELKITYSIAKNLKVLAIVAGIYLVGISAGVIIYQLIEQTLTFFFYAGIVGAVVGIVTVYTFIVSQSKPIIVINNEQFHVHLPKQRIDGAISWDNVHQVGIGLSHITMATLDNKNYKIDLENLKYSDIRAIKSKLIEICEAKNIPYSNS